MSVNCISLRTCFYILGLISSTPLGSEILIDYGWEATLSPLGLPTGMVIPTALDQFLAVSAPSWHVLTFHAYESITDAAVDRRSQR
jgi:hypothetical protein